jgi:hypothetical protein
MVFVPSTEVPFGIGLTEGQRSGSTERPPNDKSWAQGCRPETLTNGRLTIKGGLSKAAGHSARCIRSIQHAH